MSRARVDQTGPSAPSSALGVYYDRLSLWTWLARPFGYGGGSAQLTLHRLLSDPRAGGRPTATRVHDVIADALPSLDRPDHSRRAAAASAARCSISLPTVGRFGCRPDAE
jgi:hypothetical protein